MLSSKLKFLLQNFKSNLFLYAGDIPELDQYNRYIGLSVLKEDKRHLSHNILNKFPLLSNKVDVFQAEDVFEHIQYESLLPVVNEVYRVLKKGGVFRLSVPDYRCDILSDRTEKNTEGNFVFDPGGGGFLENGVVKGGGHVWFPTYEKVRELLDNSNFDKIVFYHYYDENYLPVTNIIDYSFGYVKRTPDHDERVQNPYRPMSIVVDCIKV